MSKISMLYILLLFLPGFCMSQNDTDCRENLFCMLDDMSTPPDDSASAFHMEVGVWENDVKKEASTYTLYQRGSSYYLYTSTMEMCVGLEHILIVDNNAKVLLLFDDESLGFKHENVTKIDFSHFREEYNSRIETIECKAGNQFDIHFIQDEDAVTLQLSRMVLEIDVNLGFVKRVDCQYVQGAKTIRQVIRYTSVEADETKARYVEPGFVKYYLSGDGTPKEKYAGYEIIDNRKIK